MEMVAVRDEVIKALHDLKAKYTREGTETLLTGNETAVFTFIKNEVKVTVTLYSEPLETTYFNVDLVAEADGGVYLYRGSEREYGETQHEMFVLDGIIGHVFSHQYKIIERKAVLFWSNTYMQIVFDDEDIELLRIKQ